MKRCFADTFYFLAMANPDDPGHENAIRFTQEYQGNYLTTQFVLTELANALSTPAFRGKAAFLIDALSARAEVTIIPASDDWFQRGLALYRTRSDKSWSLTDCISFLVMQQEGVQDALTADHHFTQAGFVALLK